jgi:hypothetical protein
MDVDLESILPLLGVEGSHIMVLELLSGIGHEDVESAESLHVAVDDLLAVGLGLQVESDQVECPCTLGLLRDVGFDILGILLLRGEVSDRAVGTLDSEEDGNGSTDLSNARIS